VNLVSTNAGTLPLNFIHAVMLNFHESDWIEPLMLLCRWLLPALRNKMREHTVLQCKRGSSFISVWKQCHTTIYGTRY
jgi:hypothetical protein